MKYPACKNNNNQRGIALILVIFIVALCSIIVVNSAYSTQLFAKINSGLSEGVQTEYLLKSGINIARVLIKEDTTPDDDSPKDRWAFFSQGVPIPNELIGSFANNAKVSLEIRGEEAKLPLRPLVVRGTDTVDVQWRDSLVRLFRELGFDEDTEQLDQTEFFKGRWFSSEELVANLIDYMDNNKEPYQAESFASGIEGSNKDLDEVFTNTTIERIGELSAIPGFTAGRIRKIMPFVTTFGSSKVNINLASDPVLRSLSERLGNAEIDAIKAQRNAEDGPFTQTQLSNMLNKTIGEDTTKEIINRVSAQSRWYQVISKVETASGVYFARAYLSRGSQGDLPSIRSLELF